MKKDIGDLMHGTPFNFISKLRTVFEIGVSNLLPERRILAFGIQDNPNAALKAVVLNRVNAPSEKDIILSDFNQIVNLGNITVGQIVQFI